MKFRYPEQKTGNLIRLIPIVLWPLSIGFLVYIGYQYFVGSEQDLTMVGLAAVVAIYFSIRGWTALPRVFVWGDEQ